MKDNLLLFCIKDSMKDANPTNFLRMTEGRKKSLISSASRRKGLNRSEKLDRSKFEQTKKYSGLAIFVRYDEVSLNRSSFPYILL